jgi:hypothetical protein
MTPLSLVERYQRFGGTCCLIFGVVYTPNRLLQNLVTFYKSIWRHILIFKYWLEIYRHFESNFPRDRSIEPMKRQSYPCNRLWRPVGL